MYLFEGTIADNLHMADPGATDDDLRRVARLARLNDVIDRLPGGWETRVGGRIHPLRWRETAGLHRSRPAQELPCRPAGRGHRGARHLKGVGFYAGEGSEHKTEGYGGHEMNVYVHRRSPAKVAGCLEMAVFTVEAEMIPPACSRR